LCAGSTALTAAGRAQVDAGDFLDAASGSRDWPITRWQVLSLPEGLSARIYTGSCVEGCVEGL
jgi:hypothetical protein